LIEGNDDGVEDSDLKKGDGKGETLEADGSVRDDNVPELHDDDGSGWNGNEHSVGGDWISLGEREMTSFNYVDENTLSTSTSFDKSGSTFPEIEENRTSSEVEQ
jgi:hypothetical protein